MYSTDFSTQKLKIPKENKLHFECTYSAGNGFADFTILQFNTILSTWCGGGWWVVMVVVVWEGVTPIAGNGLAEFIFFSWWSRGAPFPCSATSRARVAPPLPPPSNFVLFFPIWCLEMALGLNCVSS